MTAKSASWLGRRVPSAPDEVCYEATFRGGRLLFLDDYRIEGAAVIPGVFHLASVVAAAGEAFGPGPYHLDAITLREPLILGTSDARTVRLLLMQADEATAAFHVSSAPGRRGVGCDLVGRPHGGPCPLRAAVARVAGPRRCHSLRSAERVPGFMRRGLPRRLRAGRQVQVSPGSGWIECAWTARPRGALAKLDAPGEREADPARLLSGLLAACVRLVCIVLPEGPLYMPKGLERLRFHDRESPELVPRAAPARRAR